MQLTSLTSLVILAMAMSSSAAPIGTPRGLGSDVKAAESIGSDVKSAVSGVKAAGSIGSDVKNAASNVKPASSTASKLGSIISKVGTGVGIASSLDGLFDGGSGSSQQSVPPSPTASAQSSDASAPTNTDTSNSAPTPRSLGSALKGLTKSSSGGGSRAGTIIKGLGIGADAAGLLGDVVGSGGDDQTTTTSTTALPEASPIDSTIPSGTTATSDTSVDVNAAPTPRSLSSALKGLTKSSGSGGSRAGTIIKGLGIGADAAGLLGDVFNGSGSEDQTTTTSTALPEASPTDSTIPSDTTATSDVPDPSPTQNTRSLLSSVLGGAEDLLGGVGGDIVNDIGDVAGDAADLLGLGSSNQQSTGIGGADASQKTGSR